MRAPPRRFGQQHGIVRRLGQIDRHGGRALRLASVMFAGMHEHRHVVGPEPATTQLFAKPAIWSGPRLKLREHVHPVDQPHRQKLETLLGLLVD